MFSKIYTYYLLNLYLLLTPSVSKYLMFLMYAQELRYTLFPKK